MKTNPPQRMTFSVEEVSDLIGISRAATYEAIRRGEIPFARFGKRILIPKAGLMKLLHQSEPETPAA